jgi:hypothetical protein
MAKASKKSAPKKAKKVASKAKSVKKAKSSKGKAAPKKASKPKAAKKAPAKKVAKKKVATRAAVAKPVKVVKEKKRAEKVASAAESRKAEHARTQGYEPTAAVRRLHRREGIQLGPHSAHLCAEGFTGDPAIVLGPALPSLDAQSTRCELHLQRH